MLCCILQFSLISQHLFILLHIQSDAWPMVLCALAKVATFILFFAIFTKYLYKSRSDCARTMSERWLDTYICTLCWAVPRLYTPRMWFEHDIIISTQNQSTLRLSLQQIFFATYH